MPDKISHTKKELGQQAIPEKNDLAKQAQFQKSLLNLQAKKNHSTESGLAQVIANGMSVAHAIDGGIRELNDKLNKAEGDFMMGVAKHLLEAGKFDQNQSSDEKKPSSSADNPSAEKLEETSNRNSQDEDYNRDSQDTSTEKLESEMSKPSAQVGEIMEMFQVEEQDLGKGGKNEVVVVANDHQVYHDASLHKGQAHNSIEGAQDSNSLENGLDSHNTSLDKVSHNSIDNPSAKGPENATEPRLKRDGTDIKIATAIIRHKGADQMLKLSIEQNRKHRDTSVKSPEPR
jgi:hypothetical protein